MSDVKARVFVCQECNRIASVPDWCSRPICVHAWENCTPEIWDGDDVDGEGRLIEESPEPRFRTPGPHSWTEMANVSRADLFVQPAISEQKEREES